MIVSVDLTCDACQRRIRELWSDPRFGRTLQRCGCGVVLMRTHYQPPVTVSPELLAPSHVPSQDEVVEQRVCAFCANVFYAQLTSAGRCCSPSCRSKLARQHRSTPREYQCIDCHVPVHTTLRYCGDRCHRCYSRHRWHINKTRYRRPAHEH